MDFFTKNEQSTISASFQARCQAAYERERTEMKSRIAIVLLVWVVIIAYLVCPLSKARITSVSGNMTMLTNEDLYTIGGFSNRNFLWSLNKDNIIKNLENYEFIEDADISLTPFGVKLTIDEVSVVGKAGKACTTYGDDCTYYLSNGNEVYGLNDYKSINVKHIANFGSVPYFEDLSDFTDNQKSILFKELGNVKRDIRNSIKLIARDTEIKTSPVIDVTFDGPKIGLTSDLVLKVDITGIEAKLTEANLTYIRDTIAAKNPALQDGKYCYIYRSSDYVLPCGS